jgi:hypothetical protein
MFSGETMADVELETAERIEGLRAEAKAAMSAVSALAEALEPYVDEKSEFWWVARAQSDPRCAEVLGTLRDVVAEFKDVGKYHRMADEELLTLDDVKELTADFVAAYPHWETVVERVGGLGFGLAEGEASSLAQSRPMENYCSPMRAEAGGASQATRRVRAAEPAVLGEPVDDLPWQEALTSALLLFRRYEQGLAELGTPLLWDERVRRLREAFDHYTGRLEEIPPFLWARLVRDALFVPHSDPYRAANELVESAGEAVDLEALAEAHEVDVEVLRVLVDERVALAR